jgi:glycosyltransferase involved in cell wall biosynthesis
MLLKNRLEGIGGYAHEVLRRLVEQHPEDEFIFFFDRPFDLAFCYGKNVTPVVLFPPARHPILFISWFEWSVAGALEKWKPDVFLSPDNFLSLRTGIRTVLVTHDLAPAHYPGQLTRSQRWYYQFFLPKFNRRAAKIIAVSDYTKSDIIRRYDIPPARIVVAGNGCREMFVPLGEVRQQEVREQFAAGQPYFFYAGAVHPRKNVHRLIQAFSQFKQATASPAKLLVAGRFAWKAGAVKAAIESSGCRQDIHLLGYVEDEVLAALMASALACTYVSLFEGFGVPVLEAMHCEVPVITSNVSALPEVAGPAALLVNPESASEIASAMQQIWERQDLRQQLREKGRQQRGRYSWEKTAAIVYDTLQQVAGSRRSF